MPAEKDNKDTIVKLTLIVIAGLHYNVVTTTEVDLPLCPTNIQFLPQKLPMHCRMPVMRNFTFPDNLGFNFYPNAKPLPIQNLGIWPGPSPGPLPGPMPGYPGLLPPGAPISVGPASPALPMPMPMPFPGAKLPVIVMPFYSPEKNTVNNYKYQNKPSKIQYSDTDTDTSSSDTDTSSDGWSTDDGWWRKNRHRRAQRTRGRKGKHSRKSSRRFNRHEEKRTKNLVTPILQYVTKDGYVIYQKKISQPEAKEWLKLNTDKTDNKVTRSETMDKAVNPSDDEDYDSFENENESKERVNKRSESNMKTGKRLNKNISPGKLLPKQHKQKFN